MLDLLAAIVSADPPALLAWLILAFAASGYPLGIMLGSNCSPCCNSNPCTQCTEGSLPETLTVTFSGLQDRTPSPDLCLLNFSACYGSGAAGRVTAPGGDPATDKGPISAVSLTSGGSGYAKLGRVAPTITAFGGTGGGATLTPTVTQAQDACGIDYWKISSVTVTGGTQYADGDQLVFGVADGDTAEQPATATIRTTRNPPTLTASASGGTGATFTVSVSAKGTTPETWGVSGVTLTAGGTGYPSSGSLTFTLGSGDAELEAAQAHFYCGRSEPTVSVAVEYSAGSGASLTPTLSSTTGWDGKTYWYVSGITIAAGGGGYSENDFLSATVTDGQSGWYSYFDAYVSSVDENGAITGVAVNSGGEFYKNSGIIESIEFYPAWWGGAYYNDSGVPTGVTVDSGGIYYREDANASPYVATVTVSVSQTAPSAGTGATLTATVESSTSSANFGKITSVAVGNGGTNYLAWQWRNTKCCGDYWNGQSVVLKRDTAAQGFWHDGGCTYTHRMCGGANMVGNAGAVYLKYRGPNTPPIIGLLTEFGNSTDSFSYSTTCNLFFTANSNITNCSDWSGVEFSQTSSAASGELVFVHTGAGSATATVSAGGEYDPLFRNPSGNGGASCNACCKGDELPPQEITVSVTGAGNGSVFDLYQDQSPLGDYDGDFVLSRVGPLSWFFDPPSIPTDSVPWNKPPLSVTIEPCSSQSTTSFGEDVYGCDFCHKKCRIVFHYVGFEQRFCKGADPNHCGVCVDTPKCSPVGASFTMCRQRASGERLGGSSQTNPNPPPVPGTTLDANDCTDYGEPPEWTKYQVGVEVDPVTGISTGVPKYAYAWPKPGNRCPMQVTIS